MPVVYVNPTYPWQQGPSGAQAPSTQLVYRQMLSEVTAWNPDLDPEYSGRFINDAYRAIIDMRNWYALKLKGQVTVPNLYQQGQVVVTQGSPFVVGIGTGWSTAPQNIVGSLIGLQFRTSFTFNYQTITNVIDSTHLQLDTPFGGTSGTFGYMIAQQIVDFGANIKRLLWAVNQQQGWPMDVQVPQQTINAWDVWRTQIGWSTCFSPKSMSPGGSFLNECWPTPFQQQVFPFEAYQQPPDLVADNDSPVPWIRSDILVTRAVANALLFRGRTSKYYDPTVAQMKLKEFDTVVEQMAMADDNMDQQSVTWDYGSEEGHGGYGPGSTWAQSHA